MSNRATSIGRTTRLFVTPRTATAAPDTQKGPPLSDRGEGGLHSATQFRIVSLREISTAYDHTPGPKGVTHVAAIVDTRSPTVRAAGRRSVRSSPSANATRSG